jgi:hypothetical protein
MLLNWLLRLWHGFEARILHRAPMPTRHAPDLERYEPSNLHARHYR